MSTAFVHPDRAAGAEASTSHHNGEDSARGRGGRERGAPRGRGRGATGVAQGFPGSIPTGSISKLKSQLRQTKRLLTRDDITPDVRITTERRLKTLEVELEKATESTVSRELEQKMASRYRGIRFFERQKILRKIKQTKKGLLASPSDPTLVQTLFESRIDLYYILNYPKTEKYIALFPEGSYVPHLPLPTANNAKDAAFPRATMRASLRKRIEEGELEVEAEGGDLGIEGEEDVGSGPAGEERGVKRGAEEEGERPVKKVKMVEVAPVAEVMEVEVVVEAEIEEKEVRGVRQSKKDKKDLKDKKRKEKKGDAMPVEVVQATPVVIDAPAPVAVDEPTPMQVVEESAPPGETDEARGVRLSKKAKKDLKDKKRKEKKDAEAAAAAGNVAAKGGKPVPAKAGAKGKEVPVVAQADNWVEQDDFFA